MLRSLASSFWDIFSEQQEVEVWSYWMEWQSKVLPEHYESSELVRSYKRQRPRFSPPKYSCAEISHEEYSYVMGEFAFLVCNPVNGALTEAIEYVRLLVDIYDRCKGYSRMVQDPPSISRLRKVLKTNRLSYLSNYDFSQFDYPHEKLHAHTVAEYSLSTLLMKVLSHYLHQTGLEGKFRPISVSSCRRAMEAGTFGRVTNVRSLPITIEKRSSENDRTSSCPQ